MNLSFLKRDQYRVLEVKKGNNTSLFYPQERDGYFKWKKIVNPNSSFEHVYEFNNLKEANRILYNQIKQDRAKTIVGTKAHRFNEVFYKLSHTSNSNEDQDGNSQDGGFV